MFVEMLGFFAGLGILGWLFFVVLIGSLFYKEDDLTAGIIVFLFAIGLTVFFTWPHPLNAIAAHWLEIVIGVLGFAAIGGLWAIFKWFLAMHRIKGELQEGLYELSKEHEGFDALPLEGQHNILGRFIDRKYSIYKYVHRFLKVPDQIIAGDFIPFLKGKDGEKNRLTVYNWVSFWPLSLLDFLCSKLLRELFNTIVRMLRGILTAISEAVLGDVMKQASK